MPAREQTEVTDEEAPIMLEDFLERRWPEIHRTYWRRLLQAGGVRVNFIPGEARRKLRGGDLVEVRHSDDAPRRHAPSGQADFEIVHRDDVMWIANKAHGARFVAKAAARLEAPAELRPVFRVEADASGAVVLAVGQVEPLEAAFEAGDLVVEWTVLVEGVVGEKRLRIERPLGPDRGRRGFVRVVEADAKGARAAITEIEVVERFARHTLVRARLHTDRGHQLRAHLAAVRHPIVGDHDYGAAPELRISELKRRYKLRVGVVERPLLARLFLHAETVRYRRGGAGSPEQVIHVPLAPELELALTALRRLR